MEILPLVSSFERRVEVELQTMYLSTIFAVLVFSTLGTSAQKIDYCPDNIPQECTCNNAPLVTITCLTSPMETWDIRATFDAISDTLNNENDTFSLIAFESALLGQPQEVPAHSISNVKTDSLSILDASRFTRIDPEAFSGSHETIEEFYLYKMNFTNPQEAFDLVNNFKKVSIVTFAKGTTLKSIPAYALTATLTELQHISIYATGLESIGDRAFYYTNMLNSITMSDNNLSLDGIADTVFDVPRTDVIVRLERNSRLTHLPQEKFGNFLFKANSVYVGPGLYNPDPIHFLHCDERMDWICDTQITSVYGYNCTEPAYLDIYDYCFQQFGYSPLTNI